MYANVKNLGERDRLHADTCRQGGGGQNRAKSCGRLLWMAIGPSIRKVQAKNQHAIGESATDYT